jgi:hypothetical protein
LGAGLALGAAGCDLGALADKLSDAADDFERGIQQRAADAVRNAQAMIGQDGGDVTTHNGAVAVPAGAVSNNVNVTVTEVSPDMLAAPVPSVLQPVTPPVAFTPHGTTFAQAVTLSLFYEQSVGTNNLHVLRLDNEQDTSWERVDPATVQFNGDVALVSTTHFSVYTVFRCNALDGKLADLCKEFESGDIDVDDLVKEAPPSGDIWGGVVKPPSTNSGGDDAGTANPQCDQWLSECRPVYDTCIKDPSADICGRVEECLSHAQECGWAVPMPPPGGNTSDPCAQVAADCRANVAGACEAYKTCSGADGGVTPPPPPPPPDACTKLQTDCKNGNKDACTLFNQMCVNMPPDCATLQEACKAGDQTACATATKVCGTDVPPVNCEDLLIKCDGGKGDPVACDDYTVNCGELPPQPEPTCDDFRKGCFAANNGDDCYQLFATCEVTDRDCSAAADACDRGNLDACFASEPYCGPVGGADCGDEREACITSEFTDVNACDYYYSSCAPSPDDCFSAQSACTAGNGNACGPAGYCPPPPDVDMCIHWEICTADYGCDTQTTCPPEPAPVQTDIEPPPGSSVTCKRQTIDGPASCNVTSAPPPSAEP